MSRCVIVGNAGARLDHTLGIISIPDRYVFFSLLDIPGCTKDISIQGAKYPLCNGEITCKTHTVKCG